MPSTNAIVLLARTHRVFPLSLIASSTIASRYYSRPLSQTPRPIFPTLFLDTVDLTKLVFPTSDHRVRLVAATPTTYEYVALDANEALAHVSTLAVELPLSSAELRHNGQVQPQQLAPGVWTHPDYHNVVPDDKAAKYVPGAYTKYGDVTELVTVSDDRLAIFGVGDEVLLKFDTTKEGPVSAGMRRTYVFVLHNYFKDASNPLREYSVEPLPYVRMHAYPFDEAREEGYLADEGHAAYQRTYNTRVEGGIGALMTTE